MKIAIISSPYVPVPPKRYGGSEKVIYYLTKGLKEAGHEPIILGTGDSTVDAEVIPIVKKSMFFPKDKAKLPEFRRQLKLVEKDTKRLLKELLPSVDIIHSHKFDLLDFADFPNLTTLHEPFLLDMPKYSNNFPLEYYRERSHLNYVAISKSQKESFPHLKYVRVVYNGEDPSEFPFIAKPENYVCFIGRFDREKNPHMAIQLAINVGVPIKLAGKVDYGSMDYFKEEVKPYFKHPLVEYLGEITPQETVKLLSRAKCNLHPTGYREPFGLTVLEAAYCGTPTLAIERGSMPELIQIGKTGMLVEDFVEGLHQVEKCFNMDREYIAKRARKVFNYKNMTDGYIRAYKKVIRGNGKR